MAAKSKFESLSVNVPIQLVDRLDQHVEANAPFARRHSVHLAALALGLDVLAADPRKLGEAARAVEQLRHQEPTI